MTAGRRYAAVSVDAEVPVSFDAPGTRSYHDLRFPNAEHLGRSAFLIGFAGGYVTTDDQAIAEIVEAFRKVTANAARIERNQSQS